MDALLRSTSAFYDALRSRWRSPRLERSMSTLLVVAFAGALVVIELRRQGLLPARFSSAVPTNHFYAVQLAFTLLLLMEVIALVFSLAESVSNSVGMQFEIFSLILLRQAFEEFTHFTEPVVWAQVRESVVHMASDAWVRWRSSWRWGCTTVSSGTSRSRRWTCGAASWRSRS